MLRKFALAMSEHFHTPLEFWLSLTMRELCDWADAAKEIAEEQKESHG